MARNARRSRIVIVGAGFAGLAAARKLAGRAAAWVIADRPEFEFVPNVHELISGRKSSDALRAPLEPLLARLGHHFVCDRVARIDLERGAVLGDGGARLHFDALIVAVGSAPGRDLAEGARDHALALHSVRDGEAIARRIEALAAAGRGGDVVVVGGGYTGVEVVGELVRRRVGARGLRVHLVERAGRLLEGTSRRVDALVRGLCARHGVAVHTGAAVARVDARAVHLADGRALPADLTIWTAGLVAPALPGASGLAPRAGAWAPTDAALQSPARAGVFVAGDAAAPPVPLARQAWQAQAMGAHAADNALRFLAGEPLLPFRPARKPLLVSFGDVTTLMLVGRRALHASALAALKEGVFQFGMAQLEAGGGVAAGVREIGTALPRSLNALRDASGARLPP